MTRAHIRLLCALLVLPAAGCDAKKDAAKGEAKKDESKAESKTDEAKPDEAKPNEAKPGGDVLTLGAAKLFEKDAPDDALVLGADGSVSMEGKTLATLTPDGKLTLTDGKVVLEAKADGSVLAGGRAGPLKLTETGATITMGTESVSIVFEPDGAVELSPAPDGEELAMAHEGCDGAVSKACALAFFAMTMSEDASGEPQPSEPVDHADPPPPPPSAG